MLVRIGTVRPIWIQYRQGRGKIAVRQMVVGDDDFHPKTIGVTNHFGRAYAGIDADDQAHTVARGLFDDLGAHPITLFQPVRHMKVYGCAENLESFLEDDDRSRSVDVIVPV